MTTFQMMRSALAMELLMVALRIMPNNDPLKGPILAALSDAIRTEVTR